VTIEHFQGPVVSSNRIIGLGGAFIGVATGADAHLINPASFASRHDYAVDDWFDYDWALSWVAMPAGGDGALNVSPVPVDIAQARAADVGFDLKFGRFGIGAHAAIQEYDDQVEWTDESGQQVGRVTWAQVSGGTGLGYAFFDGELIVGVASDSVILSAGEAFTVTASRLSAGVLVAPFQTDWRVGARVRSAALGDTTVVGSVERFDFQLEPTQVVAPWEIGVGASWRIGDQTYNPRYDFSARVRPDTRLQTASRYLLVATDLIVTGPSENAIGIESFLAQEYLRVGESLTLGARLGVESEVISNRLRVRAGSYFEPSRYAEETGRLHATVGADLRVKLGWNWRINTAVDVAPGYRNFGLGLGFWH
jgi:hypothetical protein